MTALVRAEHRREELGFQGPTSGKIAIYYVDLLAIVTHPAFRIGFLDAMAGKDLDHDRIGERIIAETPVGALKRIGWSDLLTPSSIELAQYRYEEGRIAVVQEGLCCKAWGHPDFPPAKVRQYIWNRADKAPRVELPAIVSDALRGRSSVGPLFEAHA